MAKRQPTDDLAARIARDLFTNWQGDRADRLVLAREGEDRPTGALGGWSERALADRIRGMPAEQTSAPKRKEARRGK